MKSRIRLISIIAGAAVLLTVSVILIVNAVNSAALRMKPITATEALQQYHSATEKLSSTQDYCLTIKTVRNTSDSGNVFSATRQQKLTYSNFGTDRMQAFCEETMTIGNKQTIITETFVDNTAYIAINGGRFLSQMSAEAFTARFAPAALLDMSLYRDITASANRECTYIRLETPLGGEDWCMPQGATIRTSSGTIYLDSAENLKQATYNIEYEHGTAVVNLTVTVDVELISKPEIAVPDKAHYIPLSAPDAPLLLELMYGYLLQSDSISAQATESINSQASGIQRDQKTTLRMSNATTSLTATFDTHINIVDLGNGGKTTDHMQTESFHDNVYAISNDGGKTFQQSNVTAAEMQTYCQDYLVKNVILPEYISSVTLTEQDATFTLQIVATDELAKLVCKNACMILYNDAELLNNLASSYKTQKITCYYTIDKFSLLPVAAGIEYAGEHTIEGFAYNLTYQGQISYAAETAEEKPQSTETTP